MGIKESSHIDIVQNVTFELNLLICGNYVEANVAKDLIDGFKQIKNYNGRPYIKEGIHKYIKNWNYYLFSQDKDIGNKTYEFIQESIKKKKDYKNIIVFFSGLIDFTYKDLIKFYDEKPEIYHCNILIITQKGEAFISQNLELKNINENLIKNFEIDNDIDIYIHLIEVSSYCNQLGDEIGFPKNILNEQLLDKDNKLMLQYLFTFNILLCGKPGGGKSTLINRILGKKKAYAGKGSSSMTYRIIKYISDKYPITIYDSPGFQEKGDFERVQTLIKQKNETLNEERNRIHCVFYVINLRAERTFNDEEIKFLISLLNQNMDIYFIITHAGTRVNAENFIEVIKVNLDQYSNKYKRIEDLKQNIYPVELIEDENYKRFGIEEIFTSLYNKYKDHKYNKKITSSNISEINSIFLSDIKEKDDLKKKLTALSQRIKVNFKILASTLENSPTAKGSTNLSTSVIKIISKIYNHYITTRECLDYIQNHGYKDEFHYDDTTGEIIKKFFLCIFYSNGPAAKQVESLACSLIEEYNLELNDEKNFYGYLNIYNDSINYTIDSLKEIK